MELIHITRSRLTCFMPAHGPAAVLAIGILTMVGVACTGGKTEPQFETTLVTEVAEPTPTMASIAGATWILESVDGRPLIAGTYLTLTINGPQFGGFDGCNSFRGGHESGIPVVKPDGD